ncbi:CHAD domain-containing protein [Streptomyces sp. INA 01156]
MSKDLDTLSGLVTRALDLPPGHERDLALHDARKKTKRTRYAAEAATRHSTLPPRTWSRA